MPCGSRLGTRPGGSTRVLTAVWCRGPAPSARCGRWPQGGHDKVRARFGRPSPLREHAQVYPGGAERLDLVVPQALDAVGVLDRSARGLIEAAQSWLPAGGYKRDTWGSTLRVGLAQSVFGAV